MTTKLSQKQKFEQTETRLRQDYGGQVGEIPADWEVKSLGDKKVAEIIMGQSPDSTSYNTERQGLPFYQGKADFGLKIPVPTKWCSSPARVAEKGDILLSVRAPVGDVNLSTERCCIGRGITALRASDECFNEFLFYFMLHAKPRLELLGTGAIFKAINKETLFNFPIPIPPKPEQKKIAYILSKIQQAVENQETIIAHLKELKSATMAKLFREGLRGEPLKQTEIGEIPQSWEIKTLTDCCEKPQYGYSESSSTKQIGPKFLRITDITEDGVDWSNVPYCVCRKDDFKKWQLKSGDILVARIGATTGKNYLIRECPDAVFASYLIRLRVKNGLILEFLSSFMDSNIYWKQVQVTKGQNLKGGMNGTMLSQIVLPFPCESEQKEITGVIKSINRSINMAIRKRLQFKFLFSSTLNQLMTGRLRIFSISGEF